MPTRPLKHPSWTHLVPPPFIYSDNSDTSIDEDSYLLRIPPGISATDALIKCISDAGDFPGWFGYNWDALLDCLRDFSWINKRTIVILHSDLPLVNETKQCRTYLRILAQANSDWLQPPRPGAVELWPEEWPFIKHDLRIIFPTRAKAAIERILSEGK